MGIVANLLGLVGTIFNWVIVITVFQYATYFGNSQGMLVAWGILRDLGNIILLFGFIFMGICTILDIQSYSAKKALPALLIFAVLLNFSLFAAEVVVDGTNLLSASLFQQAGQSLLGSASCGSSATLANDASCAQVGIAGAIIQESAASSLLGSTNIPTDPTKQLLTYSATILFMGIVLIVLLAASVMFFTRAVMLTILLIISPIGFAGMAIPPLQGMASEWWRRLISNAVFAPVFLLLVFVSLKVMGSVQTALVGSSGGNLANALSQPSVSIGNILILYGLVIGFMIAALMFARSSGVAGAQFATKFAQRTVLAPVNGARRLMGAGASNVGGFAYRSTVGAAAAGTARRYNSLIGNLRARGGVIGDVAKVTDYTFGGNIENALHKAQSAKIGSSRSYDEQKKFEAGRDAETSHANEIGRLRGGLSAGLRTANGDVAGNDQIQRAIQGLPQNDLENVLKTLKEDQLARVAMLMSSDKLDKALDSKELNASIKEQLVHGRFAAVDDAVKKFRNGTGNFDEVKAAARKLSNKEIKMLAVNNADLYGSLAGITNDASKATGTGESVWSNDQINDINKNEALTTSQRKLAFDTKRVEQLKNEIGKPGGGNSTTKTNLVQSMAPKDLADAPQSLLRDGAVIDALNIPQLSAIMAKDELDTTERTNIMVRIAGRGPGNAQYEAVKKYINGNAIAASWWQNPVFI